VLEVVNYLYMQIIPWWIQWGD